ncbi:MAG: hypothetical protein WAN03_13895 [Candidatus Sulfotelmatobacter sp.]
MSLTLRARALLFACLLTLSALLSSAQVAVTTYHYDNNRTGWNNQETVLTPANVATSAFGLLYNVALDDQVDGQPLYVPGVNITAGSSQGTHNVVYVSSENNTVYAIDAESGAILLNPNFGKPVRFPIGCSNNGPNVGINSTPVIDLTTNTLYVVIYTNDISGPTYRIHALDLGSLTDKVTPQVIVASHTMSDGTTFNFNATYQRQRPGLLLANGNIYAGFGSFCDLGANLSRGWLLGWAVNSLTPLPGNQLNDTQPTDPDSFFLSSIWMSGYGLATDDSGNILFVTGNSDYSGTTYDGVTNIQESVVKISPNLITLLSIFTPSNQSSLDQSDADFGSGGVLALPDQKGSFPHMSVAAGKYGSMYLMDTDSLGGYFTTKNNVLGTYSVGGCWCGQSYFKDADGAARIVSSGGTAIKIWRLTVFPKPVLTSIASSTTITDGQDPGFFTSISSNGSSNAIVWALSRPISSSKPKIYLYAFNPDSGRSMTKLFQGFAGAWPNVGGNSNLVPVVANGEVFVASNKQLQAFGLTAASKTTKNAKK